ncbi:hypothetical protein QR98_0075550 [Sarcoptes scabiei]|uniref:Uncharacterized protein n=1 Tax=Sarcoptes scabiei TaxID=52283 RepID=A0A132ADG1_SARSC|nr:hypothetical protein QR98_0075550 [Sarcoptes scabiei]
MFSRFVELPNSTPTLLLADFEVEMDRIKDVVDVVATKAILVDVVSTFNVDSSFDDPDAVVAAIKAEFDRDLALIIIVVVVCKFQLWYKHFVKLEH